MDDDMNIVDEDAASENGVSDGVVSENVAAGIFTERTNDDKGVKESNVNMGNIEKLHTAGSVSDRNAESDSDSVLGSGSGLGSGDVYLYEKVTDSGSDNKMKTEADSKSDSKSQKAKWSKKIILTTAVALVIAVAVMVCVLIATHVICLQHVYLDATCTEPQKCKYCGETVGEPLGHEWKEATCTEPKTCAICSATEGEAAGHKWKEATCTAPKTCTVCGKTEGSTVAHKWKEATCTEPKTCSVCKKKEGSPLGHKEGEWVTVSEPTLSVPGKKEKKCERCGAIIDSESVYKDIQFADGSFNFESKEFIDYMNQHMNSKYQYDWSQYKIIDNNGKNIYQVPLYKDGIYTNVTIAVSEADNGKVESFVMLGKDRALVTAHGVLVGQKIDSGIDTDKVLTAIALNKSDYTSHNTHFMFGKEGDTYMLGVGYIGD